MNGMVDPWGGMQQSVNALRGLAASTEAQKRTALEERRTNVLEQGNERQNQAFKLQKAEYGFKMLQTKSDLLDKMLPRMTKQNYGRIVKFATAPVTEDGMGALPEELFKSEEAVSNMTDDEFENYKNEMIVNNLDLLRAKSLEEAIQKIKTEGYGEREKIGTTEYGKREAIETKEFQKREKMKAKTSTEKADPRLKNIMDRVQSNNTKIASLKSGQEIYFEQPGRDEAIQDLTKENQMLAKRYAKLGGDPADLGVEQQAVSIQSQPQVAAPKDWRQYSNRKTINKINERESRYLRR